MMTIERYATQTLQSPQLDFMRLKGNQLVKTLCKIIPRIRRQAKDQVSMDIGLCLLPLPAEVVTGLRIVLFSADQRLDSFIECLNADLELQTMMRELLYDRF